MVSSVAVYCGSSHGTHPEYTTAARAMGTALARSGLTLVYGGGNVGLMGEVADACLDAGGEVHGVIPKQLVDKEMAHPRVTLHVVDTMAQRKTKMEELADAFVAMPGGMGTMEELTEVLTMQQLGHISAPVALLDVRGFWNPWCEMMDTMVSRGFLNGKYANAMIISEEPEDLLKQFSTWVNPGDKWAEV
ncbi:TIGR00730 family Rossman fold protein [Corynebacterium breve]|uniref:Cytokinin riboside 5'-monophosphate phosphoribohydrolase n=1 Tax=Corynebacterium breve TaxID=3049799 RepID=A0ABY8VEA8_9CORY|nr:TIGR00730 family Rossman fold protein [Corynebacterium breve]WIM67843.1 TIGR00730 family Rossman fold protein [Corynebacterium breve]